MQLFKKIIFLLLMIFSLSCKTRLEKEGWQRTPIVSRFDTSTINKKEKEVFVVRIQNLPDWDSAGKILNKSLLAHDNPTYFFNAFVKDSIGKIINQPFPFSTKASSKSDVAYYKWESDSVCFVKVLGNGNVQASYEFVYSPSSKRFRKLQ